MLLVINALEQVKSGTDGAATIISHINAHPLKALIAEGLYEKVRERDNIADKRYSLQARRKKADKYTNTDAMDKDIEALGLQEDALDGDIEAIVHESKKMLNFEIALIVNEFSKY